MDIEHDTDDPCWRRREKHWETLVVGLARRREKKAAGDRAFLPVWTGPALLAATEYYCSQTFLPYHRCTGTSEHAS